MQQWNPPVEMTVTTGETPKMPSPTQGEKPSSAKATEDTPAEARAVEELLTEAVQQYIRSDLGYVPGGDWSDCGPKLIKTMATAGYMISSPQEGATAVGADDCSAWLTRLHNAVSSVNPKRAAECRKTIARIEALQRQVGQLEANLINTQKALMHQNITIDQNESSLRTLGDALERATRTIRRLLDTADNIPPDVEMQARGLTPPTQKPATCPECLVDPGSPHDLHYLPSRAREIPATPASPSDKGADE